VRVVLDTNVLISHLLPSSSASVAEWVTDTAVTGRFTILVNDQLLRELSSRVTQKPYLAQRIELYELTRFLTLLSEIAELVPLSSTPHPSVVRDAEDDYLIALAVTGNADILVTGDRDLLAIADLTPFRIMTLRAIADLLDQL